MIQIDTIPKELQSIQPFVRRFNELEAHNPVIAYWSLYWAAQMALSSSHGVSNECKDFLLSLIEHLEDVSLENILFLFLNVGEGFFSFFFFLDYETNYVNVSVVLTALWRV